MTNTVRRKDCANATDSATVVTPDGKVVPKPDSFPSDERAAAGPLDPHASDLAKTGMESLTWSKMRTNVYCTVLVIVATLALAFDVVPCGGGSTRGVCHSHSWIGHVLAPIVQWYLLDALIAMVHITFDNPSLLKHKYLGQMAFEFQEHHVEPWKIARWPVWYQATDSFPPVALYGVIGAGVQYYFGLRMAAFMVWTAFGAMMGQYVHRICHTAPALRPGWMKLAARFRLVVTPEDHAAHHATLDCSYAQLNGLTTGVLDWARTTFPFLHELNTNWPAYLSVFYLIVPCIYIAVVYGVPAAIFGART